MTKKRFNFYELKDKKTKRLIRIVLAGNPQEAKELFIEKEEIKNVYAVLSK